MDLTNSASVDAQMSRSGVVRSGQFLVGVGLMALAPVLTGVLVFRGTGAAGRGELATYVVCATLAALVAVRGLDAALLSSQLSPRQSDDLWHAVNRRLAAAAVLEAPIAAAAAALVIQRADPVGMGATWLLTIASADYALSKSLSLREGRRTVTLATDACIAIMSVVSVGLLYRVGADADAYALAVAGSFFAVLVAFRLRFRERRSVRASLTPSERSQMQRNALPLLVSRGLLVMAFRIDRLLLVILAGLSSAGIYAAAIPFAEVVGLAALHLAQISTVELSAEPSRSWWATTPARIGLVVSAVLALLVIGLGDLIMALAYGSASDAELVRTVRILAVASFVSGVWRLAEGALVARGSARATVPGAAAAAAAVVVITILLADALGSTAAAIASLVGYSLGLVITLLRLSAPSDPSRPVEEA